MINKKIITLSLLLSSSLFSATYTDYNQMLNSNTLNIPLIEQKIQTATNDNTINNLDRLNNFQNTNGVQYDWSYSCIQDLGCNFIKSTVSYGADINTMNTTLKNVETSTNTDINSMNNQQINYTNSKVSMYNNGVKDFLLNNNLMSGISEGTDHVDSLDKMDLLITENGLYQANFKVLTEDSDIILYEKMGDSVEAEFTNEYTNAINTEKITNKINELNYYKNSLETIKNNALAKQQVYLDMTDTVLESVKSNQPVSTTEQVGTKTTTNTTTSSIGVINTTTNTTGVSTETRLTNYIDALYPTVTKREVVKTCTTSSVNGSSAGSSTDTNTCTFNEILKDSSNNNVAINNVGETVETVEKGYIDTTTNNLVSDGIITTSPLTTTTDSKNITSTTSTTETCTTTSTTNGTAPNDIITTQTINCSYIKNTDANGSYTEKQIENKAKTNGLREATAYLDKVNTSLNDLNSDLDILNSNLAKIEEANKEERYIAKITDITQQFQLALYLSMSYEDYALRNDFLYDKNLAYQIYSGECVTNDFSTPRKTPTPTTRDITLNESMIASYNELCKIHKQAEDISFTMNKLKQRLKFAIQSYLLGEYDFGIFDSMYLPPVDEVGYDLPLASVDVKTMYVDNNEYVSKFTEKIVVDMFVINENYPLQYQLKNRDFYEELEVGIDWDNKVNLDVFVESLNSIEVPSQNCDYTGCVISRTSNIENLFIQNNFLLAKDELTEIEKANNLKFIGNLLKMNRLVKEAEAVLEVSPGSGFTQIENVKSIFDTTFPNKDVYVNLAKYKMRYKIHNGKDSDKSEGAPTYEKIIEHIRSGDSPLTGGAGEQYNDPSTSGGAGGTDTETDTGDTGTTGSIGETGGGTTSNPYDDIFPPYIPVQTDFSRDWEGGLLILDDYILSLYLKDLNSSGLKDVNIRKQNVTGGSINMLYDFGENGRSNILHNDNRVLRDKFRFQYSNDSNFKTDSLKTNKNYKGVNDNGFVIPTISNNFKRGSVPTINGTSSINTLETSKNTAKTISPSSVTLSTGAKCMSLGGSCTPVSTPKPSYTTINNWGK